MIFNRTFQAALTKAAEVAEAAKPPARPPTPRAGRIMAGGATAQLLDVLAGNPRRFYSHREIRDRLRDPKGLSWSLRRAQLMGWIVASPDPRSASYRRYRITEVGQAELASTNAHRG